MRMKLQAHQYIPVKEVEYTRVPAYAIVQRVDEVLRLLQDTDRGDFTTLELTVKRCENEPGYHPAFPLFRVHAWMYEKEQD